MSDNIETTQEKNINTNLWGFLTTFWDFLADKDRDLFENFWKGMLLVADDMNYKATRLLDAIAPENSNEAPIDNYYEILLSPLTSRPMWLDPTGNDKNYTIRPFEKILIEPGYGIDLVPIYNDMIKLSALDYYKIRNSCIGSYVVVKVDSKSSADKYFKISNILSTEEPIDRKFYAEVNREFNTEHSVLADTIGVLAIEGLYFPGNINYKDISNYRVQITLGTTTTVTWGTDYLFIKVASSGGVATDGIAEIVSKQDVTPTNKWAILTNKSGKPPRIQAPVFQLSDPDITEPDGNSKKFKDLFNYKCSEFANNKYYNAGGKIWKWFDGYNSKDDVIDETINTGNGEYVNDYSLNSYFIVVDGDLSYLGDESFSIHLTTGRAYDVESRVISLPYLHTYITSGYPIEFRLNIDYTFINSIIEFNENVFETNKVSIEDIVYCRETPIIEDYSYSMHGTLVNLPAWSAYNHDNYSGKTAIVSAMQSIQNISSVSDYHRALNVFYGQPIAPKNSKVLGLYESYSYTVVAINSNAITVDIKSGSTLHNFIQPGGKFLLNGFEDVVIASIDDDIDRPLGRFFVTDGSVFTIGDKLNLKLTNKFKIVRIVKETPDTVIENSHDHVIKKFNGSAAYVTIYSSEGFKHIRHIINIIAGTSLGEFDYRITKRPELIIYGTENFDVNYNGIYHASHVEQEVGSQVSDGLCKIDLYKRDYKNEPLYNDYIPTTTDPMPDGMFFVHIPWPTHKFLLLQMDNGEYYKAYIDSPIDTIYDTDDQVDQYQVLTRNASVLTKEMFPNWSQFEIFHKYNGISMESDVVEMTKSLSYIKFGAYFPSNSDLNIPELEKRNMIKLQIQGGDGLVDIENLQDDYDTYEERNDGLENMMNILY